MSARPSLIPDASPLRCIDCEHADPDDASSYVCPACQEAADTPDCPGGGVDDLCAYTQGLDPYEDGCGLCTLGMNPELLR